MENEKDFLLNLTQEERSVLFLNNKKEIERLKKEISVRKEGEAERLRIKEKARIAEEQRLAWANAKMEKEDSAEIERSIKEYNYVHGKPYKTLYEFTDETNTKYFSYRVNI